MWPTLLTNILPGLIDKIWPDPAKADEAKLKLLELQQNGELKALEAETNLALGQLRINEEEAKSASVFVSGWRPFFGWCGGAGFAYATIIQPILVWYGTARGGPTPPDVNIDLLWTVVTGLLGIGGLRSLEKVRGVTK